MAGLILGIDFLRKLKITVAPETSQIMLACTAMAPPTTKPFLPSFAQISEPPFSVLRSTEHSLMQPIPDTVPADVKRLLLKFPNILHMGDVMPTLTHGVEHHIHTGSHPPVLQNLVALIQNNLR